MKLLRMWFPQGILISVVAIIAVGSAFLVLFTRLEKVAAHAVDGGTPLE